MMMPRILLRHLLGHVLLSTLVVGGVLLVVLVTYQLAFVLGRAADGQLPAAMVLPLAGYTLRGNLNIILPFALLLGTVAGLGRLYHDSEITAALACGVGARVLYLSVAIATLALTCLAAWISFIDAPAAARQVVALRTEALRTAVSRGLTPGEFRSLGQSTTLYFRSRAEDGTLLDVFIQRDLPGSGQAPRGMQVLLADEARYSISAAGDYYQINLARGRSYEGVPGEASWRQSAFGDGMVRIPVPQAVLPGRPRVDALANAELLGSADPRRAGELHWRIAWVINVLVLGMLAVPLARLRPGQGRHARVPLAVLLFAVYAGLLSAGRNLLERGDLPLALGLWWVHLAVLVLGLAMLRLPTLVASAWWRVRRAG